MSSAPVPIDGLVIIDKPSGWTSHDVVARMRRLIGIRRIGHAGTLDPLATGVLPLGIGQGTRVLEYVSDAEKSYVATATLGATTDSYDADGAVIATGDWSEITEAQIRRTLAGFRGEIEQRPPVYSAIKRDGVPLHRLARAGRAVEAPSRRVTIHALDVLAIDLPRVTFAVRCSKGTYVRSLVHDLGIGLGCGAHLSALRRTATGSFHVDQAVTLERWEQALADGSWPALVLPLDAPLLDRSALILGEHAAVRLRDGVGPTVPASIGPDGISRAYDAEGFLLALLRPSPNGRDWRVEKVLVGQAAGGESAKTHP